MTEKEAYWSAQLVAVERSGLSGAEYARRAGISAKTLGYWRWRLKGSRVSEVRTAVPSPRFMALRVTGAESRPAPSCTLVLTPSMRLEMTGLPSPEWLGGMVRALGREAA